MVEVSRKLVAKALTFQQTFYENGTSVGSHMNRDSFLYVVHTLHVLYIYGLVRIKVAYLPLRPTLTLSQKCSSATRLLA